MTASRRSARLRMAEEQTNTTNVPTTSLSRANAPTAKPKAKTAKHTAGQAKGTDTQTEADSGHAKDLFSSLPPELMAMVLGNIKTSSTMSALARTSRNFYGLVMPRLYDRIDVACSYHAHIAKFIRTIEPLLSISQKKQLKKEGQYRGQQPHYPTGLDANAVPLNARFVRQLVVGNISPGRKHDYICVRYIEELLKNLRNLEILNPSVLTPSIAESIASMKNLQSLSLFIAVNDVEELNALSQVKNLKHLDFTIYNSFDEANDIVRSIIRNSASTLRSLSVDEGRYGNSCFNETDWRGRSRGGERFELTSLHTLRLRSISLEGGMPNCFKSTVNLLNLRELELASYGTGLETALPLYSQLISVFGEAPRGAPPALRSLTLSLREHGAAALLPSRLLCSFDTLTSLTLQDTSSALSASDPAVSEMLQRAILKQKNLQSLRFAFRGLSSEEVFPYMPATIVRRFIKGLPHLREFEFAPVMEDIAQISRALLHGPNLTSVDMFSLQPYPTPTPDAAELVGTVLGEILSHYSDMNACKKPEERVPFVWEQEIRLRSVSVNQSRVFDIVPIAGPRKKGVREHCFLRGGQYRVLCRESVRS